MLFLNTTIYGLKLGLCYAVAALGMYIAYSILDFPDLTTDGSFPLGGVISTVVLYRLGFPPLLALAVAFIVGALMGALTACKIQNIQAAVRYHRDDRTAIRHTRPHHFVDR